MKRKQKLLFSLVLLVLSRILLISSATAQNFPPATSCVSNDLQIAGATLTGGNACNSCTPGTTITRTLTLSINNTTNSTRTSFAFWGTLEIYDGATNVLKSSTSISGCKGPLPGNTITKLDFNDITYSCGDFLKITNLYLAWTDASPNSTCPLDPSLIAPKCGTLPSIEINAGVNGALVPTNILCFGGNTGAIDLTPSGGTSPYTYSWVASNGGVVPSGQSTGQDLTGLVAGTYTVTITDSKGCSISKSANVTQPASAVAVSLTSKTNVACYGGSTGAINITASGGVSPYTYAWTGTGVSATAEDQTGLAPGIYSVIVTDHNGCATSSLSVTITQSSAALSASITAQTNVACYGGSTGSVTVAGAGGTSPYSYSKDGTDFSNTTGTFTGLAAGNYTITVKDANGCTTTQAVTITQPSSALSASITAQTNVACYGNSTGSVTVAGAGGTSPYAYSSDGTDFSNTTGTFSGLAAGSYTITVKDANGCTTTQAVTITQPSAALSASITAQTNVACYGNSTGSVTVAGAGGTSPYSYSSDGTDFSNTSGSFTGLAAGNYTITLKDANGCTTTQAVTITQPSEALSASITAQTNVDCYGNSTGSVTVAGSGGTSPYSYSKDGTDFSNTTGTFTGLAAGNYTITVKDANGCTTTQAVTITQPSSALTTSITAQTNVDCYGNSTGSVTVAGAGGTSPYSYSKDGTDFSNTTGTFSSLVAGNYTITVKDANGCTTTQAVTITQPSSALSASVTDQTNVDCYGNSTGSVTVAGAGGTSPYSYSSDGTDFSNTTGTFSSLVAGNYTITVKDANGCTTTQAVTITQPSSALSASITAQTNVDCYGNSTGSVTVAGAGGTSPYSYSSDGTDFSNTTGTFIKLAAGNYTITVKDANGCTTTQAVTITQPSSALSASITAQTNVDCYGNSTGSVTVAGAGGTSPYSYSSDGTDFSNTSGSFTGLAAGNYTITVKDANGCTTTQAVTITQPSSALSASITAQTNADCSGNSTGSVTVAGAGGTSPYSYSKDGTDFSNTTGTFTGLAAGNYTITVKDANGCTTTQAVTITQPSAGLSASITAQTNVACYGNSTGSVTVAGAGGTSPYSYSSDGTDFSNTSGSFTGLAAGNYTITVKDANGCTTTQAVTITQPSEALSASITAQTNVDCYGNSTGSVTVAGAGGTSPYSYSKDGTDFSNTSGSFTGLAAGNYTITVKDANGCTTTQAVTITQPSEALSASITAQTNVDCYGNSTGSVTVAGSGGTSPYSYSSDGTDFSNTTGTFIKLAAGNYTITIKDANGCTTTQAVTITQPSAALSASITAQTNVACYGNSTGSVTVAGAGGTSPYAYSSDGTDFSNTTGTFSGLTAGSYTITVKDANGCTTTQAVTITQPSAALSASITAQTNVACYGGSTGSVTVAGAGGTSPYSYSKDGTDFSNTTGTFTGLAAGNYTITVKDANGCTTTQAVTITQPSSALSASITAQTNVDCTADNTGSVTVAGSGGTSPYTYSKDGIDFTNTTGTFSALTAGSYTITVKDANGCTTTQAVTILPPAFCGGHIFPTQTTCSDFKAGTTQLDMVCTTMSKGRISNVTPGVFFYYTYITSPGGTFTVDIVQSSSCGSKLFTIQKDQVYAWSPTCTKIATGGSVKGNPSLGRITISGVDAGTQIVLSVKYDTKSIVNGTLSSDPCNYTFVSKINGVNQPGSDGSVKVGNCSSTPLRSGTEATDLKISSENHLSVTAYPNPFTDKVSFSISSTVSGKASLDVYNILGQKIQNVYQGYLFAGKAQIVDYKAPSSIYKSTLIYILRVGNEQVNGKVIQIK